MHSQASTFQLTLPAIAELLDRYAIEVVPRKAATSQAQHAHWIKQLRAVFGAMPLDALEPQHIYRYVDRRSRKRTSDTGKTTGGRIAAHHEVEVLSHAFTKEVEWGYVRAHPFKNRVRLEGEPPRERYIEDWEVVEVLSLPSVRKRVARCWCFRGCDLSLSPIVHMLFRRFRTAKIESIWRAE